MTFFGRKGEDRVAGFFLRVSIMGKRSYQRNEKKRGYRCIFANDTGVRVCVGTSHGKRASVTEILRKNAEMDFSRRLVVGDDKSSRSENS